MVNYKSSQCWQWHPGLLRCSVVNNTVNTWQWRHNEHDSVSNHQPNDCLLNHLFRRRSKKTSKLRVTGLRAGIHRVPLNSPHKGPVTRAMFPFDDVIMRLAGPFIHMVEFQLFVPEWGTILIRITYLYLLQTLHHLRGKHSLGWWCTMYMYYLSYGTTENKRLIHWDRGKITAILQRLSCVI